MQQQSRVHREGTRHKFQSLYKTGRKRFNLTLGLIAFVLASLLYSATALAATVNSIKLAPGTEQTKLMIDLDSSASHRLFILQDPKRVVIDIPQSNISQWAKMPTGSGVVTRVRHGKQKDSLRLVADLKDAVLASSQLVKISDTKRRIVINLTHADSQALIEPIKTQDEEIRDLVVAIVAGHGGQDPGSIGPRGTQEKQVVAQIAQKLADKINAEEGLRAHLVKSAHNHRKASFRERIKSARDENADLFISIHADSFKDKTVTGSSVYVLSQRGASSNAAKWLANKANSSDLIGEVSLHDKDDALASVLLDLSQNAAIAASTRFGEAMLDELASIGRVRKKEVQYANFAVLKSPDVPSILVETGYISNPEEERKLRDPKHQNKIAGALFAGVKGYFTKNPPSHSVFSTKPSRDIPTVYVAKTSAPASTLVSTQSSTQATAQTSRPKQTQVEANIPTATLRAEVQVSNASVDSTSGSATEFILKPHKIKAGESLSALSARYNIKISALKRINKLTSTHVRIGQVIQVPVTSS